MKFQPKIITFSPKGDQNGLLIALENNINIPFTIKRCYFIYGTKEGVIRGKHAHLNLKQILICVSGSVDIYCEYLNHKEIFHLNSPKQGLYLDSLIWHEMHNFSKDAVLLVLANDFYNEKDYIRNYEDFKKISEQMNNQS